MTSDEMMAIRERCERQGYFVTGDEAKLMLAELARLAAENEALREALEFYASHQSWVRLERRWEEDEASAAMVDEGDIARAALAKGGA